MADHGITWGVLPPDTFDRVLVFSPHFDDAVMGDAARSAQRRPRAGGAHRRQRARAVLDARASAPRVGADARAV